MTGRLCVSTNPPKLLTNTFAASGVPSGFRMEMYEVGIDTGASLRLIRWPAWPSNLSRAFSSGALVVMVTAGPPGAIV